MARRLVAILLVAQMTLSSFPVAFPEGRARAGSTVLLGALEWESGEMEGYSLHLRNDTDGDGQDELLFWSQGGTKLSFRLLELPGYSLEASLDLDLYGQALLEDLGNNGSLQFLVLGHGPESSNLTVVSARDLSVLWTSPDFGGSIENLQAADIDEDGINELIFVNTSTTGQRPDITYDVRLNVHGTSDFQREWQSQNLGAPLQELIIEDLDNLRDIGLDILFIRSEFTENGSLYSLQLLDGITHLLLWEMAKNSSVIGLYLEHAGDVDADGRAEVVLQVDESVGEEGDTVASFRVLGGGNGTLEWEQGLGNYTDGLTVLDIDNDTALEALATATTTDAEYDSFITHYLFELRERAVAWKFGPFPEDFANMSDLSAEDLELDGSLEVVVTNTSDDFFERKTSYRYLVFGGKGWDLLWSSPEFQGYPGSLSPAVLDADAAAELVIAESWTDDEDNAHGLVHVYGVGTYSEEWTSGDLGESVSAHARDLVNDSNQELVLEFSEYDAENYTSTVRQEVLDGTTRALLFTSPSADQVELEGTPLLGGARPELLFVSNNMTWDIMGKLGPVYESYFSVHDNTSFEPRWSSPAFNTSLTLGETGDIDGDGKAEALLVRMKMDETFQAFSGFVIYEFTEKTTYLPDLALGPADLSLSESAPWAGARLVLTAGVRNAGRGDAPACCVTFLVDGVPHGSASVDVPAGSAVELNFTWTARVGTHVLLVAADPRDRLAEDREDNNNGSLTVTVSAPSRPVAIISSPAEGGEFEEGRPIPFDGRDSFAPPGKTLAHYWTSDLSGHVGSGAAFNATLPAGAHLVTLWVDDGSFNASASVNISVNPAPPPPGTTWAVITSPRNGGSFTTEDAVQFDGSRSTPALPGLVLRFNWSSNLSGELGSAPGFSRKLSAGAHLITLTVDDGQGGRSSATVNITVREPGKVVAVISSPSEGQVFEVVSEVRFDASNSTAPPGSPLTYLWSSSLAGPLSAERSFSRRLSAGNHLITLTVTSGRLNASALVNITVKKLADYRPVVSVAHPVEGQTVAGVLTINGTAWDDVRVVAVRVSIDGGQPDVASGTESWQYRWNTTGVQNGTHRIIITASDGGQLSSEVLINVTVANPAPPVPPKPQAKKEGLPVAFVAGALIVVVAAAAVAALLLLRKRGR